MHYASYNGHAQLVNKLVKWEADNDVLKEMRSSQEKLPFHIAKDDQVKKAFSRKLSIKVYPIQKFGERAKTVI